ncbi:MAG: hypothetical protein GY759_17905 [Chloroflexi bacterium]|nr:hypothetical protein [Chloroflexota bacterium]
MYDIHPVEQQSINDMLKYGVGFFNWAKRKSRKPAGAKSVQRPSTDMLVDYANVFARTANAMLRIQNQAMSATVYQDGAPLTVVSYFIGNVDKARPIQIVTQPEAMRRKLRELDNLLLEQKSPSMYLRRHVRIYEGNQVSLVRPSEQRFWTQSQARADADAFIAELLS